MARRDRPTTVVVHNLGGLYSWNLPFGWGRSQLLLCGASDSLMGSLHVALCSGGTRVEVSRYSFGGEIGAPFEEAALDCFEERCDAQAAK